MSPRLVLYSDQMEPMTDAIDDRLFSMIPASGATIGYLPASPDPDREWFGWREAYYARRGARLKFFGLEEEFDAANIDALFRYDAVHLSGGNTFQFLHWLRRRGLMEKIKSYVAGGGVLVGVSAGAMMMTPDISTSALCGDEPYPALEDFTGLELVDFLMFPHYEGQTLPNMFERTVYGVPDGSAIVVEGDRVEFIGPVWRAEAGSVVFFLGARTKASAIRRRIGEEESKGTARTPPL